MVASPPLQVMECLLCVRKASVRKAGPISASPRTPQFVILNLFQEPLEGTRGKGKRFRTKFGMTEKKDGVFRRKKNEKIFGWMLIFVAYPPTKKKSKNFLWSQQKPPQKNERRKKFLNKKYY